MPKKKSVMLVARGFQQAVADLNEYLSAIEGADLTDKQVTLAYGGAIVNLYKAFENMMLQALIGAINNDTNTLSSTANIPLPKHLTDEVCEYLIVGSGFFDFRGRDGLIQELKKYVPKEHYLFIATKRAKFKRSLERLATLRNYAAHESSRSKTAALRTVGLKRIGPAGSWLKRQGRFQEIGDNLCELAREIELEAPY